MFSFYDAIGIVGVGLILVAYLLLQTDRLQSRSATYSALNLIGALAILVSLAVDFNLSAALMEGCWVLISIYGLVRALLDSQQARRKP